MRRPGTGSRRIVMELVRRMKTANLPIPSGDPAQPDRRPDRHRGSACLSAPPHRKASRTIATGSNIPLTADAPDQYVVKTGDTLWDISKVFLRDPWYWPEIWYVNPQVAEPAPDLSGRRAQARLHRRPAARDARRPRRERRKRRRQAPVAAGSPRAAEPGHHRDPVRHHRQLHGPADAARQATRSRPRRTSSRCATAT